MSLSSALFGRALSHLLRLHALHVGIWMEDAAADSGRRIWPKASLDDFLAGVRRHVRELGGEGPAYAHTHQFKHDHRDVTATYVAAGSGRDRHLAACASTCAGTHTRANTFGYTCGPGGYAVNALEAGVVDSLVQAVGDFLRTLHAYMEGTITTLIMGDNNYVDNG